MSGSTTTVVAKKPATSLVQRRIDVSFTLASGGFGANGGDTLTLPSGLRVFVDIESAGLASSAMASLRIEGMTLAQMNRLSVWTSQFNVQTNNTVTISAGDDTNGMSVIFIGGLTEAFIDFSGAPNTAFVATAMASAIPSVMPATPTSFKGSVPAETILRTIATKAGLALQNNGVNVVLTNPYFWGSPAQQAEQAMQAIGCEYIMEMATLKIWPRSQSGTDPDTVIPLISAATGLIGYPSYAQGGVAFRTLFNPAIYYWGLVQLDSQYQPYGTENGLGNTSVNLPASRQWRVSRVSHTLQSETPDGAWFTEVEGQSLNVNLARTAG